MQKNLSMGFEMVDTLEQKRSTIALNSNIEELKANDKVVPNSPESVEQIVALETKENSQQ